MKIITSDNNFIADLLNKRLIQHLSYWFIFVLFFAYAWGSYDANYYKTIYVELVNLPTKIALVYMVIYFLYPRYLYKGKIWQFTSSFLLLISLAALLQRLTDNHIIIDYFFPTWKKVSTFSFSHLVRSAVNLGAVLALPMTIKLMEYLAQIQQNEQVLAKEKLEAELSFLKNQIQPHFLFNTLNSLYSLILKNSDKSLDVLHKLSELLRYMLYETKAKQVELEKELYSINNYLELEKIRYGNRLELSINIWGDIAGKQIAPMLILPFIENSFKHSTKGIDDMAWIIIDIGVKGNDLILKIENNLAHDSANQDSMVGGIGLQNVKRRLSLLYPESHELKITKNEDSYSVNLKLKL